MLVKYGDRLRCSRAGRSPHFRGLRRAWHSVAVNRTQYIMRWIPRMGMASRASGRARTCRLYRNTDCWRSKDLFPKMTGEDATVADQNSLGRHGQGGLEGSFLPRMARMKRIWKDSMAQKAFRPLVMACAILMQTGSTEEAGDGYKSQAYG